MRKPMICLFLLVCSYGVLGQTAPQWKVVRAVTLFNQNAGVQQTTLFTPTTPGIYRLSAYISGDANWCLQFGWYDISGVVSNPNLTAGAALGGGGAGWEQLSPLMFSPEPGQPLTYYVFNGGTTSGSYNFSFTIEKLQ